MNQEKIVRKILQDVKKYGDKAVIEYTAKFDKVKLSPKKLKIPPVVLKKAWERTPVRIKRTLLKAKENIEKFHSAQMPFQWEIEPQKGARLGQLFRPIERVGVYIPGGVAPLVSTVLMTVVPAKTAGVNEIILATPPPANKHILAAAYMLGVNSVYQVGGAQAIAALAYGTKTIPKVDKIVGPGNIYVTTAKKLVFGDVNIDMLAGPSEILIIADKTANTKFIKLDLLSQLEHDSLSKAVLITTSNCRIKEKGLKVIRVSNLDKAVEICNKIAPEHLELMVKNPERLIPKIKNAGIILIGHYTPVALSDFFAGTNHVLPTGGTARNFAGLSVWNFLKPISTVKYTKTALYKVKSYIKTFSNIEGLTAHYKSVEAR